MKQQRLENYARERIFRNKSPHTRIVVPCPQIIEPSSWIKRFTREPELVSSTNLAIGNGCISLAPRIVAVSARELAARIRQPNPTAKPIILVEVVKSGAGLRNEAQAIAIGDIAVWARFLEYHR